MKEHTHGGTTQPAHPARTDPAATKRPWQGPLTLSSDYAAETPLWDENGTLLGDLSVLGISEHLQQALIRWQQNFERHFRPTCAWDSREARTAYAEQAPLLLEQLRHELPQAPVEVDLWPLDAADDPARG
ncbi:hypothetical protein [Kineococcus esterisolvens]